MMIKKTTLSGRARARLEVVLVGVLERSFRVLGWFDTHSDVREIMWFFFGIQFFVNIFFNCFFLEEKRSLTNTHHHHHQHRRRRRHHRDAFVFTTQSLSNRMRRREC